MAEDVKTKILSLQLDYKATINGLYEYQKAIQTAKAEQNELKKALDEERITREEYDKRMIESRAEVGRLTKEQRSLQNALDQQIKMERTEGESLEQLRAKLSVLTKQYDNMSAVVREGEAGKELAAQIQEISDTLKGAEEDTGRFYRNVGNYTESIKAAFDGLDKSLEDLREEYVRVAKAEGEDSKAAKDLRDQILAQEQAINATKDAQSKLFSTMLPFGDRLLPILQGGLKGMTTFLHTAANGVKILSKQLVALMANPIVAALAAIAAVIGLVVAGLKGSEENSNKLAKVLAPLKLALGAVQSVLETLCGWILSAVEFGGKLAQLLGRVAQVATADIPIVGDAIRAVNVAVEDSIKLEERAAQLAKDRRTQLVEEARLQNVVAKARDRAKDSTLSYEERLKGLREAMAAEEQTAVERVRLAREELAIEQERAKQAPNSAADNERLAQLEAAVLNAETQLYTRRKELREQLTTMENEQRRAVEEAAKARAEAVAAAQQKEVDAVREAEDAMIAIIEDADERKRKQIETQYDREIDALRQRLETEQDLTAAARDAINQTIVAKETQKNQELAQVDADAAKAREEAERKAAEERAKIAEEERKKNAEAARAAAEEETRRIQNDYTERLMKAADNSVEQARITLEQRQMELDTLHQMEEESEQQFRERQLQAQQAYNDARKALAEQEMAVQQAKAQMMESITGGFSKMLDAMGQDNKAFAKMSKVLALGEIAINTGKAIAAGTAQAQSVPYPANLVAIATTIASVMANVATAISTVKSAKFATGAVNIQGAGTGTSDSILARISNGESVMNAAATALFSNELQAMNAIGASATPQVGGVTMNNAEPGLLAEGIRAAIEDMHPVVSVVDINQGQQRVEIAERLATL